ncbi:MAG: hypothetical protein R3B90_22005 [Planctomycetaceae bacterium]
MSLMVLGEYVVQQLIRARRRLRLGGSPALPDSSSCTSELMPPGFQLIAREQRPRIRCHRDDASAEWVI